MHLSEDTTGRQPWRCLGRFTSARQTLAALGSLYTAGGADWACHRDPGGDGSVYWLLSSLRGTVGRQVMALQGGEPAPPAEHVPQVVDLPPVTALELLAAVPTQGTPAPGHRLLHVLTAPELLREAVERTLTAGVALSYVQVDERHWTAEPGAGEVHGERLLLILGAPEQADEIPDHLVRFLTGLPRTSVCRPAAFCERLLLDVRMAVPALEELFQPAVPTGELWLFGDSLEGPPLALRTRGAPAPLLVQPPDGPPRPPAAGRPQAAAAPAVPPPAPALRVVPSPRASTRIDAALLTDDDLSLLRRFLPGRPLEERGHFAPGDGRHLLLAPDDLAASLPFGVPLRRIGPGACFLQSGHALVPDLPPAARARTLRLRTGVATACWQGGWCTFSLERLVPLWTLWAPAAVPPVEPALSALAREILAEFETLTGQTTVPGVLPAEDDDPGAALARAARHYAEGRLAEAAEEYRAAGSPLEAARLYEEAALRIGEGL